MNKFFDKTINAIRFVIALVIVISLRLQGVAIIRPLMQRGESPKRLKTVRRRDAEAQVNLAQARAWYAVSTTTSMAGLFNSIYEDAIFVARDASLMSNLVTPYSAQGYATRTLPIYPSLTAQEVAEGTDFSAATEWTKASHATFTPKEVMTQVIVTDRRLQTDPDDARRDAAVEMGNAIATKIDTDLVDLFTGFSTGKGAAGSSLTIANCAAALAVLRKNKVPMGPVYGVLHPYGWHDVWTQLGQPAANQAFLGEVANMALRDYFMGQFIGLQFFTSANISIDSSDDAISAIFHQQALALDTREAPSMEVQRDASLRAFELNMHAGYAVGERRDTFGVKLTHDATEPT